MSGRSGRADPASRADLEPGADLESGADSAPTPDLASGADSSPGPDDRAWQRSPRMTVGQFPTWIDYVYDTLAVAGFKRGGARERIIDVLADQSCALSVIEIEDLLRAAGTPTARASVYRVLDLLVAYGLVERVVVGEGQARFEPVQPSGHHHHHLVCDQCGKLIAFNDTGLERAIDKLSGRLGVRVESHEVLLRGDCGDCS